MIQTQLYINGNLMDVEIDYSNLYVMGKDVNGRVCRSKCYRDVYDKIPDKGRIVACGKTFEKVN